MYLLLITTLLLSGCAQLIVRDTDSALETTGKIATRVLLGIPTFGISEIAIAEKKQEEQRFLEQARYQQWFQTLTPEQQERERDRQAQLDAARIQALGMFLGSGGFNFRPIPQPMPPMPQLQPMQPFRVAPVRPSINCTTNTVGQYTYTNCQ